MYKTDYNNSLDAHFNDETKYRRLTYDPTQKLQAKNNDIVEAYWIKNTLIRKQKTRNLHFHHAHQDLGATPKLHKPGTRIIINAINNPAYSMSRYINDILTQAETTKKYNIMNSFQLKSRIDGI